MMDIGRSVLVQFILINVLVMIIKLMLQSEQQLINERVFSLQSDSSHLEFIVVYHFYHKSKYILGPTICWYGF